MDTISNSDLYTLLAVIVLGASGIYLLLPHGQGRAKTRVSHWIGLGVSGLSALCFLTFWKVENVELITRLFFYLFGLASIICAVLTITSRDPVHSALWFAAVVLATSGLFLLSGAQFLAAGTVIVYAGAIIVTFLFVIMLAQKEGRAIYDRVSRAPFLATLASFLLLFGLIYGLLGMKPQSPPAGTPAGTIGYLGLRLPSTADRLETAGEITPQQRIILRRTNSPTAQLPEMTKGPNQPAHVASLGTVLYTEHLLSVELAGALLFAALIGALAIASPKPPIRPATIQPGSVPEIA